MLAADPDQPRLRRGRETPLDPAPRLSRRLGSTVLLKREDLQPVFSFKLRGAYNKIAHLTDGGARARRHRGQRRQSRAGRGLLGAQARHPRRDRDAADDAARSRWTRCAAWAPRSCWPATATPTPRCTATSCSARPARSFIHPFDDPLVIAGQGTIGAEIPAPEPARPVGRVRAGRRRRAHRRASPATSRRCGPTCRSSASSRSRPTRCTARCRPAGA